jgi:hypothetical protein
MLTRLLRHSRYRRVGGRVATAVTGGLLAGALLSAPADAAWNNSWENLGGVLGSSPAVSSWAPGVIDVFVEGTDGALWHEWYSDGAWHPSQSDWERLSPSTFLYSPAAVSWGTRRVDVFVTGTNRHLMHVWWAGGGWGGWEDLGGTLYSQPTVTSTAAGQLDIFALNSSGHLIRLHYGPTWGAWSETDSTTLYEAPTAISSGAGIIDVFSRNAQGSVVSRRLDQFGWHPWWSLNIVNVHSPVAATSWHDGQFDLFWVSDSATVYHRSPSNNFEQLGGIGSSSFAPGAVSWAPGRIDLFARDGNGLGFLMHQWFNA